MAEPISPRGSRSRPNSASEPDGSAQTLVIEQPAPRRPRRRWIGWVVALVILAVIIALVLTVGESFARQYAANVVRDKVTSSLGLDSSATVDVDLGEGLLLLQAAKGSIDDVGIHVDRLPLGDVTGEAELDVSGVPLDSSKPVKSISADVTVSEENVEKLSSFLSGVELSTVELKNKLIRIGTEIDVLFTKVPVAVDLKPAASKDGVTFTPVTVLLGEQEISVADLRTIPGLGSAAGGLLGSRDFCVASYLPRALSVESVDVVGTDLVIGVTGADVVLGGEGFSKKGTCPDA